MLKPSLKIRKYPDSILSSPCSEVEDVDWELKRTFKDIYKLLKKKNGWALAANQVGIPLRFFVFDLGNGMEVAINPEWEFMDWGDDPEQEEYNVFSYREGCMSIPDKFWVISRPDFIRVSYFKPSGELVEGVVSDIAGRVFQHEIDHLDGKMLFEAMTPEQREDALADLYLDQGAGTLTIKGTGFSEDIKSKPTPELPKSTRVK